MILHLNGMEANFEFIYIHDTICSASTDSNQNFYLLDIKEYY